jgi:cytochrome c oxidase cbb3-type subunit 3
MEEKEELVLDFTQQKYGLVTSIKFLYFSILLAASYLLAIPDAQSAEGPPAGGARPPAYPERIVDPDAVERGRELYTTYACSFCHGADTRGGNGGPSLLRSQLVQRDQNGETIATIVRNGVPETQMSAFNLSDQELADLAQFLHSFELNSRDPARFPPETIVVGNAEAGRDFFNQTCAGCHSVNDDLQGVGGRYIDEMELQSNWLMPQEASAVMVTVITQEVDEVTGELARIDEFVMSMTLADGSRRSFRRRGELPKIIINDSLQPHRDLLETYTDTDIHNVTAYLITLQE